ncbi:MAG: hypothetical protein KDB62_07500 [Solirubrobacterales bacterium]|nr:hypothetical protein [Solirubrobacterales bacterium]
MTEDSGPLLLIVATVSLAGVCAYLLGRPAAGASATSGPPPVQARGPEPAD